MWMEFFPLVSMAPWHEFSPALLPWKLCLPSFSLTACQEGSSTEGQAALRMLAKPGTLDTVLKDTVVRASHSHTPQPKQFEEEFSSQEVKYIDTAFLNLYLKNQVP